MMLVDVENAGEIAALVNEMLAELPEPKKRRR